MSPLKVLLGNIATLIINPVIILGFVVAMIVFFYGIVQFISHADEATKREEGKQSIIYGIIGLFVMFSVYGILNFTLDSFGIRDKVDLPW